MSSSKGQGPTQAATRRRYRKPEETSLGAISPPSTGIVSIPLSRPAHRRRQLFRLLRQKGAVTGAPCRAKTCSTLPMTGAPANLDVPGGCPGTVGDAYARRGLPARWCWLNIVGARHAQGRARSPLYPAPPRSRANTQRTSVTPSRPRSLAKAGVRSSWRSGGRGPWATTRVRACLPP